MKLRIARKIRDNWMRANEQHNRYKQFQHEIGPEGEALRKTLARVTKTEVGTHKYEGGWWPKGKLIHHLGLQGKIPHNHNGQIARAFYRLPKDERMEWYIDIRVARAQAEREERMKTDPWGQMKNDMDSMGNFMGHFVEYMDKERETQAAAS